MYIYIYTYYCILLSEVAFSNPEFAISDPLLTPSDAWHDKQASKRQAKNRSSSSGTKGRKVP